LNLINLENANIKAALAAKQIDAGLRPASSADAPHAGLE
jgi:hypothetical protein